MTLRVRLSLAFLVVVIMPLAVAAIVVGRGVPHALDVTAKNRLTASRAGVAAFVAQTCTSTRLAAEILGREAASQPPMAAVRDVADRGLADYAVVTNRRGELVASAGTVDGRAGLQPADLGSCSRRQAGLPGIVAIADSVDLRSAAGHGLGSAAVAVDLGRAAVERLAAASDAQVTLISGRTVIGSSLSHDAAVGIARAAPRLPTNGDVRRVGARLAAAVRAGTGGVTVVVSVDRTSVRGLEGLVIGVLVAALVLSALIGWLLARVTTRPLAELSAAAARVAGGDLETRIIVRSRDEVGQLASAFNDMTEELRTHIGELQRSRDELHRNLARLGDTLSGTHDLGRILGVILDSAIGSARASAGAVYIMQPGRDELVLRSGQGLEGRGAGIGARVRIGDGVTGSVAATGEAVRGRVGEDLRLGSGEPSATELIGVPLRTGGGVLGVLDLYDPIDGAPFSASDLETIRGFAGQASVALDNVLLHQEAQRLSVTDALTGLPNYRYFQTTLSREIERATRFHRPLALLMLDLDLFKQVNDAHGHQVGDAVLVEVAERVRHEIREVDVVARYGGEEFVFVLPETGREGAGYTAERVCSAVRRRPLDVAGLSLRVTVSVGGAVFPTHGETSQALVHAADAALYVAKSEGRDRWRMAPDPPEAVAR